MNDIEIRRDEIKQILLQFWENQMEGKGFDFFFVLSARLDELNTLNKPKV